MKKSKIFRIYRSIRILSRCSCYFSNETKQVLLQKLIMIINITMLFLDLKIKKVRTFLLIRCQKLFKIADVEYTIHSKRSRTKCRWRIWYECKRFISYSKRNCKK